MVTDSTTSRSLAAGCLGIISAISLSGCLLGPDYKRPPVVVPEAYRGHTDSDTAGAVMADTLGFGDLPWWQVFGDEQLQQLIRTALEENTDLRLAFARVEEARGLYRQTRGALFPDVAAQATGTATDASRIGATEIPEGVDDDQNIFDVRGFVSYELDVFGRLRRATQAARADLRATNEDRRAVVSILIGDVAQAYFELRSLDQQLEISRRTVASRDSSLELIQVRQTGGVASLLEVRQAESERATAAAQVPELERQIALQENLISVLIGQNPADVLRGRSLVEQPYPPAIPLDLPSRLLDRRPDVRFAEQQLVAANARIGEAKALFFPQFSLTGLIGWSATAVKDLFTKDAFQATAEGTAAETLFDGGERSGNLQAAWGRFRQALAIYEGTILQAFREVSDALVTNSRLRDVRALQEILVAALRDAARLARARWLGGVASYIEVLDAERQLFSAELALTQTQANQLISVVQLYRALGGGWAAADTMPLPASTPDREPDDWDAPRDEAAADDPPGSGVAAVAAQTRQVRTSRLPAILRGQGARRPEGS